MFEAIQLGKFHENIILLFFNICAVLWIRKIQGETAMYEKMLHIVLGFGLLTEGYAVKVKSMKNPSNFKRADSTAIFLKRTIRKEQRVTPQQYIDFVCNFYMANNQDSTSIKKDMSNEYRRVTENLQNLIQVFGVKKHPHTGLSSIDISWPNLRILAEKILNDVLDAGNIYRYVRMIGLNYFIADHKDIENKTRLSPGTPITLNHLRLIFNKLKPLLDRIESEQTSDGIDGRLSGLSEEQIEWLTELCIEENVNRGKCLLNEAEGPLKSEDYDQGKGRLLNISKLNNELKKKFKDILKEILRNKTGFQRVMSLFTLHALNREFSIEIVSENETCYSPSDHSIMTSS